MRRLVISAMAACLVASAAAAASFDGAPARPDAGAGADFGAGAGFSTPLTIPGLAEAPLAGEADMIVAKKGGRPGGGVRGGAPVRKPSLGRHSPSVNNRSNNNIVVNRGRPSYRGYRPGGRVYYDDDDNDGLAGALVGGVIGLGVGAAIANSDDPDNTCVDNNGDGVCDAY